MSQPKPDANNPAQPAVRLIPTSDYREGYANSVQVRMSVWDFFLVFGTMTQDTPEEVKLANFQGIYLSPQQAKALANVLNHNLASTNRPSAPSPSNPSRSSPPAAPSTNVCHQAADEIIPPS